MSDNIEPKWLTQTGAMKVHNIILKGDNTRTCQVDENKKGGRSNKTERINKR